jgi:(p)ppGpp synthase/HD superfamily hydrolase
MTPPSDPADAAIWRRALRVAAHAHATQIVPGTKLPYLVHVTEVALEAIGALNADPTLDRNLVIACALLHDTIEDTGMTIDQLEADFGTEVAYGVSALSKNPELTKLDAMQESLERICQRRKEVWVVKLADRIVNLADPPAYWTLEKRREYREVAILIADTLSPASEFLSARIRAKIQDYERHTVG